MLVKLQPDPDQIRWYCQSALNGFEDLEAETAIENAKGALSRLMAYLDHTQKSIAVPGVESIESWVVSTPECHSHDNC